jgi:hypothetical protein
MEESMPEEPVAVSARQKRVVLAVEEVELWPGVRRRNIDDNPGEVVMARVNASEPETETAQG